MPETIWIIITILILLVLIFLAIFLSLQSPPTLLLQNLLSETQEGTLGYSCLTDRPCQSGLSCDPVTITCKFNDGHRCESYADCLGTSFCSGLCVSGPHGGLGQYCPCGSGLRCVADERGLRTCLGEPGYACRSNESCVSKKCNFLLDTFEPGTCASGLPNGTPCDDIQYCLPNSTCSTSLDGKIKSCQPGNRTTGEVGAVCSQVGCSVTNECVSGICQIIPGGLGLPCTDRKCADPLVCSTQGCVFPPYPNTTLAGINQPCFSNANCTSNTCSPIGRLYELSTNLRGAKEIELIPVSIIPYVVTRLTGSANRLYAVAPNNGVYRWLRDNNWIQDYGIIDGRPPKDFVSVPPVGELLTSYNNQLFANRQPVGPDNGLQKDINGATLSWDSVDISLNGDIILSAPGRIYTKAKDVSNFTPQSITSGNLARFYYDTPERLPDGTIVDNPPIRSYAYVQGLLRFNGNIAGATFPQTGNALVTNYSIYTPPERTAVSNSIIAMIATPNKGIFYNLYVVLGGISYVLPGYFNSDSVVLATAEKIYIYTRSSCVGTPIMQRIGR